jgi:type I restriction enzyme R subunit
MATGGEKHSVQRPFVRYAAEAGWTYLSPYEALELRSGGITNPLLDVVLLEQLQRLNLGIVDAAHALDVAKRFVRVRPTIEGNLDAWEFLNGLKTVFVEVEKRERNVCFLDPVNVQANRFHVTDEFTFSRGTPPDIRADIVFFVNGVPVIVVETKRATALEGIAQALDDIRYYHEQGPEFMVLAQLFALTHLVQFYYGATWSTSLKTLFNWREEMAAGDFESLCKTFVAPRRVLRVLNEFILFTRKDEELSKVVLRPHQMRAVERCVGRAKDSAKQRGLIWHTQGSGKTYTMIVTAKRLIADPLLENPTVLMLVDRNELEAQLFGNLESVGFGRVSLAQSMRHLQKLLRDDTRGLIVSMIHKFEHMPANINTRHNVFVLVDEAHRTTGGDLGNYLLGALPNATLIGFTGTPIDKTEKGKGTFKIFGLQDPLGYLDKYSIRESIQDGTTVPLHYALAPNQLQVDRETLNREFLDLAAAEGLTDIESLDRVLDRAVTLRNMLKNRERVDKVAQYVAQHYRDNVEPMGYKAFVVAVDREACCLYKEALDRYLPSDWSTVVISEAWKQDQAHMRRRYLSEDAEKAVRKAFRDPDRLPKILIVTEKLLTGFDAPVLYAIYLDKPMRDHVLLQAIARVNRPYEDKDGRHKPCGFVLDFVGIFDNLEKALAFDSQDVSGVVTGLDVLRQRFEKLMETARRDYLPIAAGKVGDKAVEAVLEAFRDKEKREAFYGFFKELQDIYEILSPDVFLRPFLPDYETLLNIFYLLRAAYERGTPVDRQFLRKTAKLVQEETRSSLIREPTEFHVLSTDALAALAAEKRPSTVKVFNLLKALTMLVAQHGGQQPYLLSIGDRAQAIAQAFDERQITTRQALGRLKKLIEELKGAEAERSGTGLSSDAFAVYYLLKTENAKEPQKAAEAVDRAFHDYPHWRVSERQGREVRQALYKALMGAGVKRMAEFVEQLMRLLERRTA